MVVACSLHMWTLLLNFLSPDYFQISYMHYLYQSLDQVQQWVLSDALFTEGHYVGLFVVARQRFTGVFVAMI